MADDPKAEPVAPEEDPAVDGADAAEAVPEGDSQAAAHDRHRRSRAALLLTAIGVVYGDIGTSPLYTIREAFSLAGGLSPDIGSVLGVLSLVFWSLIIVVTVKYVLLIMRADNKGEGGVLALAALAGRGLDYTGPMRAAVTVLSICGLGLFFGDGLITPAISVLSAVEGLNTATEVFHPYVVPLSSAILLALFVIQTRGTESVGKLFGPVMLLWFTVLGLLGLVQIIQVPSVLKALDPRYAAALVANDPAAAFFSLGAVVLAITGGEALYADMGHFGRWPIRFAWFSLVLPALVLNYFGQGALVMADPGAIEHVFFLLAPPWALYPFVILATLATIIASQAVISGVFSLTRQAVQLGLLPRIETRHTSATEEGQIYVPRMNWAMLAGVLLLVTEFRSSANLASAYGLAVTGVMAISALLAAVVARRLWQWSRLTTVAVFAPLLAIDLCFFASNALKIPSGGWLPLVVAIIVYFIIDTWRRGRIVLRQELYGDALPLALFIDQVSGASTRVPGTAVYMTGNLNTVPNALLHNFKHNQVLHQRIVFMTVAVEDVPRVAESERIEVERAGKGFFLVVARFGFMEAPNVPRALKQCRSHGLVFDMMQTSFFVGRETLVVRRARAKRLPFWRRWQEHLFIALWGASLSATAFFQIPPNRVVELGTQIEF
ncbi:MAG: potassium transporter Kup [Defluviicoccus sp.]|nr:potassium transporter Kup [Defluviicoccus sp.]MDS4012418.1 potassium transporter Kup [Defluviicoccus sp.]MDS4072527.1 potassium transporter Kup [Defluviicoccus sp.]